MTIVKIIRGRKAVFFTMVAIILASIIVLLFSVETSFRLKDKMNVVETRVTTLNSFFKDIEKDLSRGLYISGYRSLLAMTEYISIYGVYLDDVNLRFKEAMINGTVNSIPINVLQNQTFDYWTVKISQEALKIGIITNISIINLSIYPIDTWTVGISSYVSILLNDTKGTASFAKNTNISTTVGINDFEDPLYTINSYGRVFNTIINTGVTNFGNISELRKHLNFSYYLPSNTAPDFLMRLTGNLSNSTYGIESIVNLNEFVVQGLSIKSSSDVDYIYFGNMSIPSCLVNETINDTLINWFRLDDAHLATYSVHCLI